MLSGCLGGPGFPDVGRRGLVAGKRELPLFIDFPHVFGKSMGAENPVTPS